MLETGGGGGGGLITRREEWGRFRLSAHFLSFDPFTCWVPSSLPPLPPPREMPREPAVIHRGLHAELQRDLKAPGSSLSLLAPLALAGTLRLPNNRPQQCAQLLSCRKRRAAFPLHPPWAGAEEKLVGSHGTCKMSAALFTGEAGGQPHPFSLLSGRDMGTRIREQE